MKESLKKTAIRNIIYSFSAQTVSIILSVLMSLLVPKMLGVEDFSYWQLFLFYLSYVGFFHFGITDGVYLKNGGISYENLNKKEIKSEFKVLFFIDLLFLVIISILAISFVKDSIRSYIIIFAGLYLIVANLNWYLGYIFQATNRVNLYSISVMIDKLIFLVFIIIAFITKFKNLYVYIPFYIFTTFCALLFSIYYSKEIILSKSYSIKKSFALAMSSAKVGIKLTLASISSLLIIGFGRFLVDKEWGIESFGKFSFALSLTNFFLLFIAQISIVLFPTLRNVNAKTAKDLFKKFNEILNAFLPIIYVLYIPIKVVLGLWLPQYKISLDYLALLLPICIFDGKNQMINNTYFKVLREEKKLLIINLVTLLLSATLSVIGVYVVKNIYFVIISMIISVAFRSIIGEKILYKSLKVRSDLKTTLAELVYSIVFILVSIKFGSLYAFVMTLSAFLVYMLVCKTYSVYFESAKMVIDKLRNKKLNTN